MQLITKTYLTGIIQRMINEMIYLHRQSKQTESHYKHYAIATDLEILDFIHSIPYFDDKLKDFLIGNIKEENIIVSQAWEIEFIKQCALWAESYEWLHGDASYLSDTHIDGLRKSVRHFGLPY